MCIKYLLLSCVKILLFFCLYLCLSLSVSSALCYYLALLTYVNYLVIPLCPFPCLPVSLHASLWYVFWF